MRGCIHHRRDRGSRWAFAAALAIAMAATNPVHAGVVGQWDFSQGWNSTTGVIPGVSSLPGLTLVYLPKTYLYSVPAAQSGTNPPPLQFATTGSFGIGNLGATSDSVVMQVPDMRGYGLVTGLMAQFPQLVNGVGSPTKLNQYSIVMDVYVPGSTDAQQPYYLTMLQTRLGLDGAWFIDKRDDTTGVASGYGGSVTPDSWHRLAIVMNLSDSWSSPQYEVYVDGALAASIVPDSVPLSDRNFQLLYGDPYKSPPVPPDLFTNGMFSIGTLADSFAGLSSGTSAFFLFNADRNDAVNGPTKGELGTLYVANLQFRDDPMTSAQVASLGGPGPGFIPVPEPTGLGLAGAAAAAGIALRRSRRRFLRDAGVAVAGATCTGSLAAVAEPPATVNRPATASPPTRGPLADYVHAADPSTRWTRIAGGELGTGRFLAAELVSQTWRGTPWRHQFAVCLPEKPAVERPPLVLWVDGGSTPEGDVQPPGKQLPVIAAIADASGLPVAVVRQVPNQPLEGGRREDDLIAHTFEQFFISGDPTWPLLLPMVKTVAAALDVAEDLASREWGLDLDGCVVAGASKRGWTSWLAAAVEPRVRGLVPMVIDMLDLPRHMRLQVESFGAPSDAIHDYVSRGLHRRLGTPRGEELLAIVDPVRHAAVITQPKILALGANDEYWPLESLDIYRPALRGPTWISYAPNAGHDIPPERVAPLVAALGRHVAGVEPLPTVAWSCDPDSRTCALDVAAAPDQVLLWTADAASRDFRRATWASRPAEAAGGRCRVTVDPPATGFRAGLLECRYDRRPLPVYLSTGPLVVAAG
jgi:PhoPQ-activated pathogenicity-related protein